MAPSDSALKITLPLASVAGLRVPEQLLRIWAWLPVRGRVGLTLLGAFALYLAWRAVAVHVFAPLALRRRDVLVTVDRTRTIDPALREPIDDAVLSFVADAERTLAALGFATPQRTTSSLTFPIAAVRSLLEHPAHGDLATISAARSEAAPGSREVGEVTFESQLADGTRLVSTTSDERTPWPPRKRTSTVRLAPGTPPDAVYAAHRARVAVEAKRSRQTPLTRGATADQRLVFAKRETLHLHRHLVACGHRTRVPGGLRLTFKGAVAVARAGRTRPT